jgi:hypothetical protein
MATPSCSRPGAWIALIEIDDLLAHEPLPDELQAILAGFVSKAYDRCHYDFRCGRKLGLALGLQAHAGPRFGRLRDELLACLASPEHVSKCQVYFVLARR